MSINISPEFSDESYSEYEPPVKKACKPSMPKLSNNRKMMIIVAVVIVLLVLVFLYLYRQRVKKQTIDKRDNMTSKTDPPQPAPPRQSPAPQTAPAAAPQPAPPIPVHDQIVMTADDHELNKFANSNQPQVEEVDSSDQSESGSGE